MNRLLTKYGIMAMGMTLLAQASDVYAAGKTRTYSEPPQPRKLTDKEKYRIHAAEANKWHEYTINGEVIKARNKVDARKIYNQRHGIKKNKKR